MNVFTRAPYPEHPNRCQAVGAHGQCPYLASVDEAGEFVSKYCPRHGGNKKIESKKKEELQLYLASQWRNRIGSQSTHPKVLSLRDELGVLRMTMDTKLESLKDDHDLVLNAHQITALIREIRETVRDCQKIEMALGQVLDKNQAHTFIQELLAIITNYIDDPEILQMISEDMVAKLDAMTNNNQ